MILIGFHKITVSSICSIVGFMPPYPLNPNVNNFMSAPVLVKYRIREFTAEINDSGCYRGMSCMS